MSFVATQCPSCLKSIQVPTDIEVSKCMYCGADVVPPIISSVAPSVSVANLLGMARTASIAGNQAEAETYFNRVLELDPRNSEAWLGKGKAAAWQSSIANIRTHEMAVAFGHAIGTADEANRAAVIQSCVDEMNHIVATIYGMANEQMHEYVALENTWISYVSQVGQLLLALDSALDWDPNNVTTLENIVHLCKDNIEGVTYRDPYDNNLPKGWTLSPDYEQLMQSRLDSASNKLQSLKPGYVAPVIEKKKPDACFVVTATVGDESHPAVFTLRKFRAEILSGNWGGEMFIDWYYTNGPKLARKIKGNKFRKTISYYIIVVPAVCIAKLILFITRK